LMSEQIIEAKAAMEKERKIRMEFDSDSFDILIDNCCSHTLTELNIALCKSLAGLRLVL